MAKQAISITLDSDNLTWLRGRVAAAGIRSVSESIRALFDLSFRRAWQANKQAPQRFSRKTKSRG